ncbi:MAG: DUF4279 domain-containing protein [Bacteroidia bacterium]|nr:DUF4279 domain-containing protein [Bacteroidia bacterium]
MKKSENRVYLRISNFSFDPKKITEMLNILPEETFKKGDIVERPRRKLLRPYNFWSFLSPLPQTQPIEDHVQKVLEMILPKKDKLVKILEESEGELGIVSYIYDDANPGLHLDKIVMKTIADLGLELDIDLYFFPSLPQLFEAPVVHQSSLPLCSV